MKKFRFFGKSLAIAALALTATISPVTAFYITANAAGTLDANKAKAIALKDADRKESEVIFTKTVKKWDDNIQVYDIEFYHGNHEYEYEIAVETGRILERDIDRNERKASTVNSGDRVLYRDWDDDFDDFDDSFDD